MGEAVTRVYRGGVLLAEGFPVAAVSDYLDEDDTAVWVDFCAPSLAQIQELATELHLHELAIEDALGPHQRPKLDHYPTHLFFACHAVQVDPRDGRLAVTEVDAFVGRQWLITVRKDSGFSLGPVVARWDRSADLTIHGVGFLLYGLIDVVVDGYVAALEVIDAYYEEVSDAIFSGHPLDLAEQRRWFNMRRALARFHRLVGPLREAVTSLMRHDQLATSEQLHPYFQDVYDHLVWAGEASDSLRDLMGTLVETNLTLRDHRQNLIVKKVSSWAAVIAVPALITGYYGMNVPYPGAGSHWGVVVSGILMVGVSAGLYALFRRRDWL